MTSTLSPSRVAVLGYARTPFGKFGGSLRDVRLPALGAIPVAAALGRVGLDPADVDELAFGVNLPGSERSVARQVLLRSGIPDTRPSYTVDQACCSSLAAISLAGRSIRLGESRIAVAGGVDNLSRVPYFVEDMRFGNRLGPLTLEDQLVISCPHTGRPRALQAGEEAVSYGIDRQQQDEWAVRSQALYEVARAEGRIQAELAAVEALDRFDRLARLDHDEVPRPGTTLEALGALPTVYGSPTVTAGNAPDLSSGAAALVLSSPQAAESNGWQVKAWLDGWSMVAGHPDRIASIPATAIRLSLERTGRILDSIDVLEINEAFAAVPLVVTHLLADGDAGYVAALRRKVNPQGGSIAVGHPTGATAARLVMTCIEQLVRRGGGLGMVSICGGIGEAEAVLVEVPS